MASGAENKSKLGIILAVVAGLLAMGMMFVFLSRVGKGGGNTVAGQSESTVKLLVAVRDLPANHVINADNDFESRDVSESKATREFISSCVLADQAQTINGRRLGTALPSQLPLQYANLSKSKRLDDDFTEGVLRTINVSRENLFSGQLIPGDHVDVLVTMPKKKEKKEAPAPVDPNDKMAMAAAMLQAMPSMNPMDMEVETLQVLKSVEVFAVGALIEANRVQLGFMPPQKTSASEITLHITEAEALTLTQYVNTPGAKISLLLKPRKRAEESGETSNP
jgi:Flp pilus assembly protein CpaB